MASYRVISADNHVFEPADLWTSRAELKFKERTPHVERLEFGDFWFCDGRKVLGVEGGSTASPGPRVEEVRLGGYIPEEHIKDLDTDGIDVDIIYPTIGLFLYSDLDSELVDSNFKSYNDWLGEFCSAFPKRLKGIAMINVDDVGVGVKELERCAKMGFVGAMISVYPVEGRSYDKPEYEPLWAAAEDLRMPLSMHIGTNRPGPGQQFADFDTLRPSFAFNLDYWVRISLGDMILSGVLERHPKLQVGAVEHELSWVPHFLERMDFNYNSNPQTYAGGYQFKDGAIPSDFFHNNVFIGWQVDTRGIRDRHVIGVDQIQWGSDYPHGTSTFPNSLRFLEEMLADCTEEEKAKIVGGNTARVYNL